MDEYKVFVTLFPRANKSTLTKDVGQIPTVMARYRKYKGYLVTYNNDDYEKEREQYTPELNVKFLHKSGDKTENIDQFCYIIKNAEKIDVLNMYHMSIEHLLYLCLYKCLNPKGVSYLKLDIDFTGLEGHSKLTKWKKKIITFLHKGVDIISAESSIACEKYNDIFGIEPICITDGYVDIDNNDVADSIDISKEKIIMTAGRLGTKQKATEVLLEAFSKAQNVDEWKLILAGPVTDEFNDWMEGFYDNNPKIRSKIEFTGNITDKSELYALMEKTSIFALPSRWGSAEIVLPEALSRGTYLLVSDGIPTYGEYTNNGEYGVRVPVDDIVAWTDAIDKAVEVINNGYNYDRASKYGREEFNWKIITQKLSECIDEVNNERNK